MESVFLCGGSPSSSVHQSDVQLELPDVDVFPIAQVVQEDWPGMDVYAPAAQFVHEVALAAEYLPAEHNLAKEPEKSGQ